MERCKDFDGYTFVQYRRDEAVSDNRAAADDISQVQKNPSTHKNAYWDGWRELTLFSTFPLYSQKSVSTLSSKFQLHSQYE